MSRLAGGLFDFGEESFDVREVVGEKSCDSDRCFLALQASVNVARMCRGILALPIRSNKYVGASPGLVAKTFFHCGPKDTFELVGLAHILLDIHKPWQRFAAWSRNGAALYGDTLLHDCPCTIVLARLSLHDCPAATRAFGLGGDSRVSSLAIFCGRCSVFFGGNPCLEEIRVWGKSVFEGSSLLNG